MMYNSICHLARVTSKCRATLLAGFVTSLFCFASLPAVEILPGPKVPPYSLVHVRYDAAANGVVFVLGIQSGRLIQPDMVDVQPGYLVFTGPPGSYSVHGIEAGKRFSQTVEIGGTVPPDPDPDPDPDPIPLTGFPADVFQQALKVHDPEGAQRMAKNFSAVVAMIDAGSLVTPKMCSDKIAELNRSIALGPAWTEFGKWLGQKFTTLAVTMPKTRELMVDVALGLRAVR